MLGHDGRRQRAIWHRTTDGTLILSLGRTRLRLAPHRPWETAAGGGGSGRMTAPMPGLVVAVLVTPGAHVSRWRAARRSRSDEKCSTRSRPPSKALSARFASRTGQQLTAGALMVAITEDAA